MDVAENLAFGVPGCSGNFEASDRCDLNFCGGPKFCSEVSALTRFLARRHRSEHNPFSGHFTRARIVNGPTLGPFNRFPLRMGVQKKIGRQNFWNSKKNWKAEFLLEFLVDRN